MQENKVLGSKEESFLPHKASSKSYAIKSLKDYKEKWEESISKPDVFWSKEAKKYLTWSKNFKEVFSEKDFSHEWFKGGELNVSYNCLDRHLKERAEKKAIIWEDEKGNTKTYTYKKLHEEVCKFSSCLRSLGLKPRDCVTLYLSMTPDLAIAMLSCARLGLIHNVVFAGFSPDSLASRVSASQSKLVITSDGFYRKGKIVKLKEITDKALEKVSYTPKVLVFNNKVLRVPMKNERDYWVNDLLPKKVNLEEEKAQSFPSEHPLYILYTSGSTGAPKGLLHTSAGYLLGATMTCHYLFNLNKEDIFWCTADIGWITGHSYVVYGPLSSGSTVLMYEGAPFSPNPGRWWELIEKYKVTKFYTAPTALRMCKQAGNIWPEKYDLSSLELLGSVGEPINPEAWKWFFKVIGKENCPILDTWWQTETGSIMLAPFPGLYPLKPGCASLPFFGVAPKILDPKSKKLETGKGSLVLEKPVPSMARTIYKDHGRYEKEYWCDKTKHYKTNDAALLDKDGEFWVLGRLDDVINVSGHRLSTMEIESLLCANPLVSEASCVGAEDKLTGEALSCFVVLKEKACEHTYEKIKSELSDYIAVSVGSFARPKLIVLAPSLPKTRSGKIMRRTLRSLASGKKPEGDLSTLEDATIFDSLTL